MLERLSDLDEMVLRCRTEQSKEYIAEAVTCYRAGAYRAVIVNTWIAIVFDLIDKIRELSISGDAAAKKVIDDFELRQKQIDKGDNEAIKNALEFERNILSIAKDQMQLLDQQQYLDISRLREDRHRCSHPSFHRIEEPYKPSAEQARMHLRNAIFHVLSQKPVQGKAAIKKVISLISSKYFPKEINQAITVLIDSEFSNPNPSLVKGVFDSLIFGYFEDNNELRFNNNVVVALKAILSIQREVAEERLNKQINKVVRDVPDRRFVWAMNLALSIPEAWGGLSKASKDKFATFIKNAPDKDVVPMFVITLRHEHLGELSKQRLQNFDLESLSTGILNYEYGKYAVDRAIQLYSDAKNWDNANNIACKAIHPLIKYFTKDDIERIIRAPKENGADLPGSTGFSEFLNTLNSQAYITTVEINELLDKYDLSRYKFE